VLNAVGVEAKCDFGSASLVAGKSGEIHNVGRAIGGFLDIDGIVIQTTLFTEGKKRAVMTFRKRDATLTIEAKEAPPREAAGE